MRGWEKGIGVFVCLCVRGSLLIRCSTLWWHVCWLICLIFIRNIQFALNTHLAPVAWLNGWQVWDPWHRVAFSPLSLNWRMHNSDGVARSDGDGGFGGGGGDFFFWGGEAVHVPDEGVRCWGDGLSPLFTRVSDPRGVRHEMTLLGLVVYRTSPLTIMTCNEDSREQCWD